MVQEQNEINQAAPEAPAAEAVQYNAQQLAQLPDGYVQVVPQADVPVINWAAWGFLAPPAGQNAAAAGANAVEAQEEPGQGPAPAA